MLNHLSNFLNKEKGECNMKVVSRICFVVAFIVSSVSTYAQLPEVNALKNNVLIGEQTNVTVRISVPKQAKDVVFPYLIQDSVPKSLAIIATLQPDTIVSDDVSIFQQEYTIALFDTSNTFIPPLLFSYNIGDSIQYKFLSDTLFFYVSLVDVNIEDDIKDIKALWKLPFLLSDYYAHILIVILILLILFIIYYYILRRKKGLPLFTHKEKPVLSPYDEAIQGLMKIKKEKIWQSGQIKLYYSDMTYVLRNYIERNWNIPAIELPSSDIINKLHIIDIHNDSINHIKHILTIADLVKFAKASPLPTENEHCLDLSFTFVEITKPIVTQTDLQECQNTSSDNIKKPQ
jgi:hypothetical protein